MARKKGVKINIPNIGLMQGKKRRRRKIRGIPSYGIAKNIGNIKI